jgi:hypothetical protein
MMTEREPLCLYCARFNRDSSCPPRCGAFPGGIPDEIYAGLLSHTSTVNGESTFLGSIPVGWETRAPEDEVPDTAAGWTPARNVGE